MASGLANGLALTELTDEPPPHPAEKSTMLAYTLVIAQILLNLLDLFIPTP
jgi:hypothetical protein